VGGRERGGREGRREGRKDGREKGRGGGSIPEIISASKFSITCSSTI
jgi:predicted transposase YdaD